MTWPFVRLLAFILRITLLRTGLPLTQVLDGFVELFFKLLASFGGLIVLVGSMQMSLRRFLRVIKMRSGIIFFHSCRKFHRY